MWLTAYVHRRLLSFQVERVVSVLHARKYFALPPWQTKRKDARYAGLCALVEDKLTCDAVEGRGTAESCLPRAEELLAAALTAA